MISTSDSVIKDVAKGTYPQVIAIDVFADVDDITVYEINETTGVALPLTRTTHYTLSTADEWNESGANLTILSGGTLTGGGWLVNSPSRYVVLNNPAREQTDSVDNSDSFDGPTFERNWDRLQLTVKRLTYMLTTCLRYPEYEGSSLNELGTLVELKDSILGFGSTGRPELLSQSGFALEGQVISQRSKTVAIGGSANFAQVAIAANEESCLIKIIASTERGAAVIHEYLFIRDEAGGVTLVKFRDTVFNNTEAVQLVDIGTSVGVTTVTFSIDGTAFSAETDVDTITIVTKLKSPSDVSLTAI